MWENPRRRKLGYGTTQFSSTKNIFRWEPFQTFAQRAWTHSDLFFGPRPAFGLWIGVSLKKARGDVGSMITPKEPDSVRAFSHHRAPGRLGPDSQRSVTSL